MVSMFQVILKEALVAIHGTHGAHCMILTIKTPVVTSLATLSLDIMLKAAMANTLTMTTHLKIQKQIAATPPMLIAKRNQRHPRVNHILAQRVKNLVSPYHQLVHLALPTVLAKLTQLLIQETTLHQMNQQTPSPMAPAFLRTFAPMLSYSQIITPTSGDGSSSLLQLLAISLNIPESKLLLRMSSKAPTQPQKCTPSRSMNWVTCPEDVSQLARNGLRLAS